MSSIVDIINHYQTSINKSLNDTARIVHCIGKLYKLPISVRHLQDTGIGRTVNSLRKYDGEVGIAAKALVTKWKAMVAAEESDDNTANAGVHGEGADSDGRQNDDGQQRSDTSEQEEDVPEGHHNRSLPDDDDDDDEDDDDDDDDEADEDRVSHHNADRDNESYGEPQLRVDEEFREEPNRKDINSEEEESDGQSAQPEVHYMMHHREMESQYLISPEDRSAASSQWNDHGSSKRHSSGSSSRTQHHSSTSKSSSSSSSGKKHKTDGSDRKKSDGDHHHRHQSSSGGESKSHKSSSSSRSDHQGSSKKSSSHDGNDRHKDRSSSKHHTNNTQDHGAGSSSNNSSSGSSSSSHARKDSSHKEGRHRSKEERSSSSKRQATEEIDMDRDMASTSKRSRKEHRTDHGGSGQATSSSPNTVSSPTSSSSHFKKDKSYSSSSKRQDHHVKSESSRERSENESKSKSRRNDKGRSSPGSNQEQTNDDSVGDDVNVDGLDCSGGASFADALAMIGMPSGSKKKASGSSKEKVKVTVVKSSPSSTSSNPRDGGQASYSRSKQQSTSSLSSSVGRNGGIPSASDLLSQNVKLEPLPEASEIVESLPMISPHYRPMPLNQTVMECVFMGGQSGRGKGRPLTEEEALGQSMQSKNLRTKVYSGMKQNAKGVIPTLYELCIRLLQDHIDEIGATGGIPFYILKPVLERANPNQLLHLEHFNPHFVEESDVLWELHCKRTFRSKQRNEEELETWREMFLRCSEERDAKLRSLTQNIKLSQEQAAAPIRKTQLAYVDSAVKPPRSVISKQVKYGTARAPVVSPAARVAALKAGNVTQVGDARLRVAAGVRDNAQAQVFQPTKPRKAPMMAKVLSSMKGFKTSFRR